MIVPCQNVKHYIEIGEHIYFNDTILTSNTHMNKVPLQITCEQEHTEFLLFSNQCATSF